MGLGVPTLHVHFRRETNLHRKTAGLLSLFILPVRIEKPREMANT
jgi:hypothetical protein